jgi:hypothetical protein
MSRKPSAKATRGRRNTSITADGPLNFLLGCSERALGEFELARLDETAHIRTEIHLLLDRMIDEMSQAALAGWFRRADREMLKRAIENPEDVLEWASQKMRDGQRSEEELVPLTALPPGAAHLAAALRYAERNIAHGKCGVCPQPLDPNSVRYCTKHLTAARHRKEKAGKAAPGSREYLYSEEKQPSTHGRQPGTLKALATANEQKQRAILAELGIPPESAALTLDAAKESLMKHMPDSRSRARVAADLWHAALIPSLQTGKTAIKELLAERVIQRVGEGNVGNPYRYFRTEAVKPETSKDQEQNPSADVAGRRP